MSRGVGTDSKRSVKGPMLLLLPLLLLAACATPGAGQDTQQPIVAPVVNINFRDARIEVTSAQSPSNAPAAEQTAEATSKVDATVPVTAPVPTPVTPE